MAPITNRRQREVGFYDILCTFQAQVTIASMAPSFTSLSLRLLGVIHTFSFGEGEKKSHRYSRISS